MITLEEIYDLELNPGDRISVTIRDIDGVIPQYRGKQLAGTFKNIKVDLSAHDASRDQTIVEVNSEHFSTDKLIYGFHVWLIDDVQVLGRVP